MISNEIFKFFADYIYEKSGMLYLEKDFYRLETRLADMMKAFECEKVEDLYEMYKKGVTPDMNALLINVSTNNETYFLRDVKPFNALVNDAIPLIIEKYDKGPFKVWSAASSTGQEAYSILMSIDTKLPPAFFARVEIDGTDISTEALAKASEGIYNGLDVQRGLPINLLMKYFEQREDGNWNVSMKLKNKVDFKEFNLLTGTYPLKKYHVIYCRNVLIYQDKKNKNVILNKIHDALLPGGFMFLGNGESLIGMNTDFERINIGGITAYQRKF